MIESILWLLAGVAFGVYLSWCWRVAGDTAPPQRWLHSLTVPPDALSDEHLWDEIAGHLADGDDVELELPDSLRETG